VVNIRFHIVSLVAVFFALTIGIGVGSSVVRSGVLERTESRLKSLDRTLQKRNAELEQREAAERTDSDLDQAFEKRLLVGALRNVPVLVVKLPGADNRELRLVSAFLEQTEAIQLGVVSFSARVRLGPEVDVRFAAIGLESYSISANAVSARLKELSVTGLTGGPDQPRAIARLVRSGFATLTDRAGSPLSEVVLPLSARIVVLGSSDQDVKNAKPFASGWLRDLASKNPSRLVALDSEAPIAVDRKQPKLASDSLVQLVRSSRTISTKTSTIDGSLSSKGVQGRIRRTALLALLLDGERSVVGHFGTAENASAIVPRLK
jgi:hypothetical protein